MFCVLGFRAPSLDLEILTVWILTLTPQRTSILRLLGPKTLLHKSFWAISMLRVKVRIVNARPSTLRIIWVPGFGRMKVLGLWFKI